MDIEFFIELEKKLLDPEIRKDQRHLQRLLADNFVEFGSSGIVYNKRLILDHMSVENYSSPDALDFTVTRLASEVVLLTYKTRRLNNDGSKSASLRSSLWKYTGDEWQMIFHQGTKTDPN